MAMQAAASICFAAPLPVRSTRSSCLVAGKSPGTPWTRPAATRLSSTIVAVATAASDQTSTVDYSSSTSVFPAEACETIGGEACDVEMFPEVKPVSQGAVRGSAAAEEADRDYLEYNENPKTVFPGEACDDLGGEFCEAEYQQGVYRE